MKSSNLIKILDLIFRPGSIMEEAECSILKKISNKEGGQELLYVKAASIEFMKKCVYTACNNPQILFYFS